jgi:hypothetical protein
MKRMKIKKELIEPEAQYFIGVEFKSEAIKE